MPYQPYKKFTHVPASIPADNSLQIGDPIGSFVGYLRRPKSTSSGLVAQFFGENGEDADVISALHLTRFLNTSAKIVVWMIKDHTGRLTKINGEYQKLTEFVAVVRRPQPSVMGQVAQFFGENGANADSINILNQSQYLDALVYVQMYQALPGMNAIDISQSDNPHHILEEKSQKMTSTEQQEFKKIQKKASDGMRLLELNGFFRQESVLAVLGTQTDYLQWLSTQNCCHPGKTPCLHQPVQAWHIPGTSPKKLNDIPLCVEHAQLWNSENFILPHETSPLAFAQTQHIYFVQKWAKYQLNQQLHVPFDRLPTPGSILTWAIDKKIHSFIPAPFKALIQ